MNLTILNDKDQVTTTVNWIWRILENMSSCCLSCNKLDDDKLDMKDDIVRVRDGNAKSVDANARDEYDNVKVNDDHVKWGENKIYQQKCENSGELDRKEGNDIMAKGDDNHIISEIIGLVNIILFSKPLEETGVN